MIGGLLAAFGVILVLSAPNAPTVGQAMELLLIGAAMVWVGSRGVPAWFDRPESKYKNHRRL
jgi:hypothetical protein